MPPICTAERLPFVRQCAPHLYGSTFGKILRERKTRMQLFFAQLFEHPQGSGHPGNIPGTSQVPPFETQGRQTFKGGHELFDPNPFAWKTPTPPGGLRIQKVNLCARTFLKKVLNEKVLRRPSTVAATKPGGRALTGRGRSIDKKEAKTVRAGASAHSNARMRGVQEGLQEGHGRSSLMFCRDGGHDIS